MGNYNETLARVAERIINKKKKGFARKAMVVGIEGLTNSGKSTFTDGLRSILSHRYPVVTIDGDLFHRGREVVESLYRGALKLKEGGYIRKIDLQQVFTWKLDEFQHQVLDAVRVFNNSRARVTTLVLNNVLKNKTNHTEHAEKIKIARGAIVLIPMVYLRNFSSIDLLIFLQSRPDTLIKRKIARIKSLGITRDVNLSKQIITQFEVPTLQLYARKARHQPDIVIDTTNFDHLKLIRY